MTEQELKAQMAKKILSGLSFLQPKKFMEVALPKLTYATARTLGVANKQKPVSAPKPAYKAPETPLLENIGRGLTEAGAGAVKGFAEGVGNTGKAITDAASFYGDISSGRVFMPKEYREQVNAPIRAIGDVSQKTGQLLGENVIQTQKKLGLNPDSLAGVLGGGLGMIASQVPSMIAGGKVTEALKSPTLIAQGAQKVLPGLRNLGAEMAGGAVGTHGAMGAMEGRMANPEELAMGAAIDTASFGLGKLFNKLSKNAYSKILAQTPVEQAKNADRGIDLAQTLSDKGYVSRSKAGLAKKAGEDISRFSGKLDDLISQADGGSEKAIVRLGEKAGITSNDLLANVRTKVLQDQRLRPKFGEMKAVERQIDLALAEFKKTVGNKVLTFSEVQSLKKKLGNSLTSFLAKSGDAKGTARELVNDVIRDNAKKIIENNVKGAAELNKQMAPLITAQKQLKKKGSYSGVLTDAIIGGTFGGGAISQGQSPEDVLKSIAAGVIGKKILQSPIGRSLRGRMFRDMSKTFGNHGLKQGVKNLIPAFNPYVFPNKPQG